MNTTLTKPRVLLVGSIGGEKSNPLQVAALSDADFEFVSCLVGDGNFTDVSSHLTVREKPSVVLIDAVIPNAIAVAQLVRREAPAVHVVFLVDKDAEAQLRRDLTYSHSLGSLWSVSPRDNRNLPGIIGDAVRSSRQRAQFRTTLDGMNLRLSERPRADASEFRKLVASDRFLANVLRYSPDAIISLDQSGTILDWNAACESLLEKSGPEACGKSILEVIPWPNDFAVLLERVLQTAAASSAPMTLRIGADAIDIEVTLVPVSDDDSRIMGMAAIVKNNSTRKRSEEALIAERKALALIATGKPLPEVLEEVVHGVEAQSRDQMICSILLIDDAGTNLLHGAAPSLPKLYNDSIDGLRIGPGVGSCGTAAFEKREVDAFDLNTDPNWKSFTELTVRHGLGSCSSKPFFASDGTLLGTVAMYYTKPHKPSEHDRSITSLAARLAAIAVERDKDSQKLRTSLQSERSAREEVERTSRMKDEFLATLSHELRTPLNAILGWSQIISRGKNDVATVTEGLTIIERNARSQAQIIEDLLDMSRIVNGTVRLDVQRVELAATIQAAIETVRPAALAKNIRLVPVLDPSAGPVSGDFGRLQQIFWNLLSNAVKFTPKGGKIQVILERINSHVEVSIIDSGEGISKEFLPHVFDRFRQADGSTTRNHGGLGLGLSIVKQLVELHGGSVTVKSDGDRTGSTFTVSLPQTIIHADLGATISKRHPVAGQSVSVTESHAELRGLHVLVVDDETDSRILVRRLLEDKMALVTEVSSAAEAIETLKSGRFDVLVSDIGMPVEDGYCLIKQVRALPEDAMGQIPAVALTAYARAEDRTQSLRAGFDMHIAKPVEASELLAVLARLAGRNVTRI